MEHKKRLGSQMRGKEQERERERENARGMK
jgi:hypothetical protein